MQCSLRLEDSVAAWPIADVEYYTNVTSRTRNTEMTGSVTAHTPTQQSLSLCHYTSSTKYVVGHDSSVNTATRYELDGPGIESRWG
jgi:hypothetical protein